LLFALFLTILIFLILSNLFYENNSIKFCNSISIIICWLLEGPQKYHYRFHLCNSLFYIKKEMSGNSLNQDFLEKSIVYIHQNLGNTELSVENLAFYLLMSRSQTYRKIKALTGQSVTEFIRTIRLKMAISLFEKGELNVSEVAFNVGFTSPAYFTKCFRIHFGKSPTAYFTDSGKRNGQK
jgi:AraC-like DNA-binding protein